MTRATESMRAIHRKTAELLPWYVTGSLSAAESAYVEEHLRECLTCRAGLREERQLRRLIREQDDFGVSQERGISDLLSRIEGNRRRRRGLTLPQPGLAVAVASLAAVVMVGAFLGPRFFEGRTEFERGAFETLTDAGALAANQIDIVFADEMDPAAVDAFLQGVAAELVSGPTELGRYTVAIPYASRAEIDDLLRELGADPMVRFAGRNRIDTTGTQRDPP